MENLTVTYEQGLKAFQNKIVLNVGFTFIYKVKLILENTFPLYTLETDLSPYEFYFSIFRQDKESEEYKISTEDVPSNIVISDNQITIQIPFSENNFDFQFANYEFVIYTVNIKHRILEGEVNLIPEGSIDRRNQ